MLRADPRELHWEMAVSLTSCSRVVSEEKRETTERKGTSAKPETLPSAWWRGTPATPVLGMTGRWIAQASVVYTVKPCLQRTRVSVNEPTITQL